MLLISKHNSYFSKLQLELSRNIGIFFLALLDKLTVIRNQSELQVGFSEGLSPGLGSLFLSEASYEAHIRRAPLYIAPMDSQKAFVKQDHKLTLCELYTQGVDGGLWSVVSDLYEGLTSKIKCQGEISEAFPVLQGGRQGGVLSPHFYDIHKSTSPGYGECKTGNIHRDSICGMSYMCRRFTVNV